MSKRSLPLSQVRRCGPCTVCCTTHAVASIDKPEFSRCSHLRPGNRGCGVYKERPESCREWACLWLLGLGSSSDRPDKLGVVFDVQWSDALGAYGLKLFELRPGAHKQPRVEQLAQALLRTKPGVAILYQSGDRRTLLGGEPAALARAEAIVAAGSSKK